MPVDHLVSTIGGIKILPKAEASKRVKQVLRNMKTNQARQKERLANAKESTNNKASLEKRNAA
jgi:hypothetical protein